MSVNYIQSLAQQSSQLNQALIDSLESGEDSVAQSLLFQLESILNQHAQGVDVVIETREELKAKIEQYQERIKDIRSYVTTLSNALQWLDTKLIEYGAINNTNRIEGTVQAICIQDNPLSVDVLIDTKDGELMENLLSVYPGYIQTTTTYTVDKKAVLKDPQGEFATQFCSIDKGKHVRIRRSQSSASTNGKALP